MFPFNPRNLLTAVFCLIVIQMVTGSCDLYEQLDWDNSDINFQAISGLYSVITTNHQAVFSACEVHGVTQAENGSMMDRYKMDGSPCSTVFQNRITKTSNAFQFAFFGDDMNCIPPSPYRTVDNMKMKVLPDGECFFKSFCLPDGTSVINMLCRNPDLFWLTRLLNPIVNLVLGLLGDQTFYIDQRCYNQIVNNPTDRDLLLKGP